jgi:ribonuclease HII
MARDTKADMAMQLDLTWSGADGVAGVDEAGRGPLAGPVAAAAVMLDPQRPIAGLKDSKQLTAAQREALAERIRADSLAWAVAWADHEEIDRLNILQASLLAMTRAVAALERRPQHVLVDGNRCPSVNCRVTAIVKGDSFVPAISAASILAKVERDSAMRRLDGLFPGYGFAVHKGYPTAAHLAALDELGACAVHRRSFAPVRRCLERRIPA